MIKILNRSPKSDTFCYILLQNDKLFFYDATLFASGILNKSCSIGRKTEATI
jgi:hypothetical protein